MSPRKRPNAAKQTPAEDIDILGRSVQKDRHERIALLYQLVIRQYIYGSDIIPEVGDWRDMIWIMFLTIPFSAKPIIRAIPPAWRQAA